MMTDMTLSTERVLELIEAYGAEPGAWPDDERAAASMLIAESPDLFASALADSRALDALLLNEAVPEPSAALSEAILAAAPAEGAFVAVSARRFRHRPVLIWRGNDTPNADGILHAAKRAGLRVC